MRLNLLGDVQGLLRIVLRVVWFLLFVTCVFMIFNYVCAFLMVVQALLGFHGSVHDWSTLVVVVI